MCPPDKCALVGKYVILNITCWGAGKYVLAGRYALFICNGVALFLPVFFFQILIRKLYVQDFNKQLATENPDYFTLRLKVIKILNFLVASFLRFKIRFCCMLYNLLTQDGRQTYYEQCLVLIKDTNHGQLFV